jgi:hypothetical protein
MSSRSRVSPILCATRIEATVLRGDQRDDATPPWLADLASESLPRGMWHNRSASRLQLKHQGGAAPLEAFS